MLLGTSRTKVYVYKKACDMRKGIDGLSGLVRNVMRDDPIKGHYYLFMNRRRDQVKLLYWDGTGYCVWLKRLCRGRFPFLTQGQVQPHELLALLEGAKSSDLERTKKKRYE